MRRFLPILLTLLLFSSCEEEIQLTFTESNQLHKEPAVVEINIPVAQGETKLAKKINRIIELQMANTLNFSEEVSDTITLPQAIANFNTEYESFKNDFEDSALIWEATFDGEVTYNSDNVVSIAISSYMNTGGAHGSSNVIFYNIDKGNAKILHPKDILNDIDAFKVLAEKHFLENASFEDGVTYDDYFFGEGFKLPENIGFNDDGLILFYNVYEIAPYAMGITEFTIPFDEIDHLLMVF